MFGKLWNFLPCIQSKSIRCHYSKTTRKTKKQHDDQSKRRTPGDSMKDQIQCPFEIRFSHIHYVKKCRQKPIFYKVKITHINAIHECSLSKDFFTKAGRVTRGKSKYNIPQLSTVIDIMRNDPNIDARNLRTLLKDVIPSDLNLDAKFICNFRSRVALHISKFVDGDSPLTSLSANFLTVNKSLTQEEMSITNNPIICTNFTTLTLFYQ